jgi:hypothetical protein
LLVFGKPQPKDPTRPMATFKTVWTTIHKNVGVTAVAQ